jgi:MFS family permease
MTATQTSDTSRLQRRTLVVLVISQVVGTVGIGVAPTIGVLLAEEVTSSPAWSGLARVASTLGAAVLGLPLGAIAARWGRRRALTLGWLIASFGAFIVVYAAQNLSVVALFPGLFLVGAGSAVSLQSRFAATDLAAPHHRARALALVVWVGTVGSVLGPNLGVPGIWIGHATGLTVFASGFLIAATFLLLGGIVVFLALRPDPLLFARGQGWTQPTGRRRGGIRLLGLELRTNPRVRLAVLAIVTAQIVMVSIMTMSPVHIADDGGTITIIGITISLHVAGMYGLAPVVGILVDRAGHRVAIILGICILAVALFTAAIGSGTTGGMIAALLLLGIGWSFTNVAGSALFASTVADETRASAQGAVDALANLLGATAAFVAGPLLAATSFPLLSELALLVLVPLTVVVIRNLAWVERPIA